VKIHVKWDVIRSDLKQFVDIFKIQKSGTERHQKLADHISDPNSKYRKLATFTLIADCAACGARIGRKVNTIWENGSPISVELHDEHKVCPACKKAEGFHYAEVESLHA
jgi:hypothetical protein